MIAKTFCERLTSTFLEKRLSSVPTTMGRIGNSKLPLTKRIDSKPTKISISSTAICQKFKHIWKSSSSQIQTTLPIKTPHIDPEIKIERKEDKQRLVKYKYRRNGFVPPRSGLQFKVGPPFALTTSMNPVYIRSTNEYSFPYINARLDRGFDLIDGEWIGYKRNYFSLVAAFEFEDKKLDILNQEQFYYINDLNQKIDIDYFALKIISICCEDKVEVPLVEHTAKRDKGPQNAPKIHVAVPGTLPSHNVIKQATNIRNSDKIDSVKKLFLFQKDSRPNQESNLITYPNTTISKVARYERIQYSSAVQYKKICSMSNRHYTIRIQLLAMADNMFQVLAYTETPPLVVRGRSPSNYKNLPSTSTSPTETPLQSNDKNISPILQQMDCPTIDCHGYTQKYNKPPNMVEEFQEMIIPPPRTVRPKVKLKITTPLQTVNPILIESNEKVKLKPEPADDQVSSIDNRPILSPTDDALTSLPNSENILDEFNHEVPNWLTPEFNALNSYHKKSRKKTKPKKLRQIVQQTFDHDTLQVSQDYASEDANHFQQDQSSTTLQLSQAKPQEENVRLDFIYPDPNFPTFEEFTAKLEQLEQFEHSDSPLEYKSFVKPKHKTSRKKPKATVEADTSFSRSFHISKSTSYS